MNTHTPNRLLRFLRTVRHLRFVQILDRVLRRVYRPSPSAAAAPALRQPVEAWCLPPWQQPSLVAPRRFRFLNEEHELNATRDWNRADWPRLWLYNLHYFDDLNAVAATERRARHRALLTRWVTENPPTAGAGWEPYPTSLRVVNWIKAHLSDGVLEDACLHSLAIQARHLQHQVELHLLGNHVLANAKALVFAGLFFRGSEATRWLNAGLAILEQQIPEQVLEDGGHFERSPMYHCIVLNDLLEFLALVRCYVPTGARTAIDGRDSIPKLLGRCESLAAEAVGRMLAWLQAMAHPDGEIPLLNDAAFGVAPRLEHLTDRVTALGATPQPVGRGFAWLQDSGFAVYRTERVHIITDIGDVGPAYQPGHAHAGTLSFELSLDGKRLIVDTGTSTYTRSDERLRQRGTAAHNTACVDGQDSSEVWAGHRVARRARVVELEVGETPDSTCNVTACHDGYTRLAGVGVHRRSWAVSATEITITDHVDGTGQHTVEIPFHLHPDIVPVHNGRDSVELRRGSATVATLAMDSQLLVDMEPATYHPEFGKALPTQKAVGRYTGELPVRFECTLAL